MRRSSFRTYPKSESKTSFSDSSTKGSNLKVGTTLEPQITPHTVVSPIAESPAREAVASGPSPIVAPSPLGAILGSRPQEAPAPTPLVSSDPPAPRLPEPELQVVESPPSLQAGSGPRSQSSANLDDPPETEKVSRSQLELPPFPALPRAPANPFSREEIVNDVLDLTDQVASTALFGSIGTGKSSVALTLLHHNRTKVKFGSNRHFMRCGDLKNSLEGFLERLSDAIGINHTTSIGQLRSHLESSPPLILLLDGVDSILDPLAPEAEDIFATIEEFGCYQHICLLTTSRMYPEISGFHRVEVPTLSEGDARNAFYGLCHLGRSSVIDDLITRLDFHPLSIDLLASSVRENNWDESTFLKAWDDGGTGGLEVRYRQALRDAVEPSFLSPTIQNLGTAAREALSAIAAFPSGIKERRLEGTFPGITGVGVAVDVLCKFSLLYRQDGFVKMLSPFRFYFLDSMLEPAQRVEVIRCDATNSHRAEACMFLSF